MRLFIPSIGVLSLIGLCLGMAATPALAQSTISNDPFEIDLGKGTWGVLLPSYDLGTDSGGSSAFQDDLDNPGFLFQLRTIRRFLGTRTSFESRWFYGWGDANSLGNELDIDFANPATGATESLSGGRSHLSSDLDHYGFELTLRDTWQTRFGGLSAGIHFSYFAFDQDFDTRYGGVDLFEETLESDFIGGKGFVGWDGFLKGRASNIDVAVGYFDVDAEYEFNAGSIAGERKLSGRDFSTTVEVNATTRTQWNLCEVGLTFGVMYISDMPQIIHAPGAAATLGDGDAVLINGMVEWIF